MIGWQSIFGSLRWKERTTPSGLFTSRRRLIFGWLTYHGTELTGSSKKSKRGNQRITTSTALPYTTPTAIHHTDPSIVKTKPGQMSVTFGGLVFSAFELTGRNSKGSSTTTGGSYGYHSHETEEQGVECLESDDDTVPMFMDVGQLDESSAVLALDSYSQFLQRQIEENSPSLRKVRLRIDTYHGSTFRLLLRSLAENTVLRKLEICRSPAIVATTGTARYHDIEFRRSQMELHQLFGIIQNLPKLNELVLQNFGEEDIDVLYNYIDNLVCLPVFRLHMRSGMTSDANSPQGAKGRKM
jgi:hypothetical protein